MAAGRGPTAGRGANPRPGAGARSGVRPAAAVAGRTARAPGGSRPSRLRRLAVLGVIAVVLTVLLAPAMRSYVAQRRQMDALAARVEAQRAQVTDLQRQRAAWDDPAYVKAQARDRLKFVMPGDRAYTVIDPAPAPATKPPSSVIAAAPADRAWFGSLWDSTRIAGSAARFGGPVKAR